MLKISLPSQLAGFACGARQHTVDARTVLEAFDKLDAIAPMLRSQIFHPDMRLRQFVGLFVNDEQVLELDEMSRELVPGSELLVVQSVAGG